MHRADEGGSRAHLGRKPRARIGPRVGDPERLAGLPYRADEARAGYQLELARRGDETLSLRRAVAPRLLEAHLGAGGVDREITTRFPAFGFADRAQHALQDGRDAVGRGQHAVDRVLEAQALLGALVLRDVAADAAVAAEAALGIEHRFAADREPAAAFSGSGTLHLEIAERLLAPQLRTVTRPVPPARIHRRLVPVPPAEVGGGIEPGLLGRPPPPSGEAG